MSPKSFRDPARLRLEQEHRTVMVQLGDAHMAKASALLKRAPKTATRFASRMDKAAHHLLGAYGAFSEAGMGAMAAIARQCREDVQRMGQRARAL